MERPTNFLFLVKLLRQYWQWLVVCSILGLLMSTGVIFKLIKPEYKASVQILVNRHTNDATAQYVSQQADVQMITTYKELITSPAILKPVIQDLYQQYGYDYSLDDLKQMVSITSSKNSQVLSIGVINTNPDHSTQIANQVAQNFKKGAKAVVNVDNVTVVAPALRPNTPILPKPTITITTGVILGLLLGLSFGLMVHMRTNQRIKEMFFVRNELQLRVLGQVGHQSHPSGKQIKQRHRK